MIATIKNGAERGTRLFGHIDWFIFGAALAVSLLGIITMYSFPGENMFFERQLVWLAFALVVFLVASLLEYTFLRRTPVVVGLYGGVLLLLGLVLMLGTVVKGAQERFNLGFFFVQPSDPAKVALVVLLAKYFSRRHIEIAHIRHILVSGAYAALALGLVFFQPDIGSALIVAMIWLGVVLVAGISWKHLATLVVAAAILAGALWQWGLQPYQQERIAAFLHPLSDLHGAGYNAYQAAVATGSGQLLGKGVGYGTQSKLQFLPEYETDFIFAAFAEEWGFVGVALLFGLFAVIIVRALSHALRGSDNFHSLFAAGVAIYIFAQFVVHVGMNIGLLPITGTTLPFMSYGGSHLITEFAALGALMGMRRRARSSIQARDEAAVISGV
ncbi:rod shape-determining protein RodA [Candidatus Kaiserbacteria bacterium]|nr:rod shape-determining protein RodA [Candidatus Kaiserbacteria bacterium]